jgi:hypothetical protein
MQSKAKPKPFQWLSCVAKKLLKQFIGSIGACTGLEPGVNGRRQFMGQNA